MATIIDLDDELNGRVRNLALARDRSRTSLLLEAITQYVDREEGRERLRRDTLASWEEYRTTGLHATADDVEEWLASWGTEGERPVPRCHE